MYYNIIKTSENEDDDCIIAIQKPPRNFSDPPYHVRVVRVLWEAMEEYIKDECGAGTVVSIAYHRMSLKGYCLFMFPYGPPRLKCVEIEYENGTVVIRSPEPTVKTYCAKL